MGEVPIAVGSEKKIDRQIDLNLKTNLINIRGKVFFL